MIAKWGSQKTVARPVFFSGAGLHTGRMARVEVRPGKVDSGTVFFKNGSRVGRLGEVGLSGAYSRQSAFGEGTRLIGTVEHLLAALSGLQVRNVEIRVEGDEIPALDGSAAGFIQCFKEAGVVDQKENQKGWEVREPIFLSGKEKSIAAFPSDQFEVQYVLDYDFPGLRQQTVSFLITPEIFEQEIAPSRTFCTEAESQSVRAAGLGLGADATNTIVVGFDGKSNGALRFPDECARHKVLDIVGDLELLGFPIRGRIVGIRSGHALNRQLVESIQHQKERHE